VGVERQKPGWRLRTRTTRGQATAEVVVDKVEQTWIDRTEIGRVVIRKEIVGQLVDSG
jgi:hypothetical protein